MRRTYLSPIRGPALPPRRRRRPGSLHLAEHRLLLRRETWCRRPQQWQLAGLLEIAVAEWAHLVLLGPDLLVVPGAHQGAADAVPLGHLDLTRLRVRILLERLGAGRVRHPLADLVLALGGRPASAQLLHGGTGGGHRGG